MTLFFGLSKNIPDIGSLAFLHEHPYLVNSTSVVIDWRHTDQHVVCKLPLLISNEDICCWHLVLQIPQ